MDKNAIKKYAIWARRELISRISGQAAWYGITEDNCMDADSDSINGHVFSATEKKQRAAFISKVKREGYEQAIEEVAYMWFNRFCALRYMEVNGYLPTHVRVFTNDTNEFKPQILDEAIHLELAGLDKGKILAYKDTNDTEGLYRYLLITQCNDLSSILPGLFQKIEDYTELLLPENLLREGSVIERMIAEIPEEDWTDQVQIIGWLYQFYNVEPNELVYDGKMSKNRIPKELLPAATTIYTPNWVVHYMVENSLGRLWLEGHPNDLLKSRWKYYLGEAEQETETEKQLAEIRTEYSLLKPADIKCIDPCCGSGHILVYMFDILMQIYKSYGYTAEEAVSSILTYNLYGLDIDERAVQLAYFAVMMKARSYDNQFFSRRLQPHIHAICESNGISENLIDYFVGNDLTLRKDFKTIVEEMNDAKEYGSILKISLVDFSALYARIDEVKPEMNLYVSLVVDLILPLIQVAELLAQKYNIVVTNPPYLGRSRFSPALDVYAKKNYPEEKADLSMVMLKKAMQSFVCKNGFIAFITTSSWMFLSSFENTRKFMFANFAIDSLVDFGTELFEGKVGHNPIVSWINRNSHIDYNMTAIRLVEYCYSHRDEKKTEFFESKNRYTAKQTNFSKIPGSPLAYFIGEATTNAFLNDKLKNYVEPRMGLTTGNNEKYLRFWYEVDQNNIGFGLSRVQACQSKKRWFPYNKGGEYRKWYGNRTYVVDWFNDGYEMQTVKDPSGKRIWAHNFNLEYNFLPHITWNDLTSGKISFRGFEEGFLFDSSAAVAFVKDINYYELLGYLNTNIVDLFSKVLNPTMHFKLGDFEKIPYKKCCCNGVEENVEENISICKLDWDSFETSWDFQRHPLVCNNSSIAASYDAWNKECNLRFIKLRENEETLNQIFINIYDLKEDVAPEVEDQDITVRKADLQRDVRSLISYAVGCMFGRYSLDMDGLAYAGGDWDSSKYQTYQPDHDGILPICDDEYFTDDIVGRFVDFISTVYGSDTLEENLQFIADALGGKGSSREVIRKYFLNDFFADHCKIYQKRPIYWLFDSGKKNGFKCLIYLHRYQPDTIARIRTDYVHEQQARYRTAIADLENRIETASTSGRIKLNKELKKVQEQADELHDYEEKIHHLADQYIDIDLDDGVKVNYAKFQDVLAKIK